MTKAIPAPFREGALSDYIGVDDLVLLALDATYVYDTADDFLDDVVGGARVDEVTLTTLAFTDGYLTSDAAVFTAVAGGDTITQFWIYRDTGVEGTSELVYYFNEDANGSAFAIATDGTDITISPAVQGWFRV